MVEPYSHDAAVTRVSIQDAIDVRRLGTQRHSMVG
jgi:hypothetical protein